MPTASDDKPQKCPVCGAKTVQRIIYGLPAPGFWDHYDPDEVFLGGCTVTPDFPRWHCKTCGAFWGRMGDDPEYFPHHTPGEQNRLG